MGTNYYWAEILFWLHRFFKPVCPDWKYLLAYFSEFQCRLIYFQFKRDRVISNVIFKILNELFFWFQQKRRGGEGEFLCSCVPCDCVATKQPQNSGNNAAMSAFDNNLVLCFDSPNLEPQLWYTALVMSTTHGETSSFEEKNYSWILRQ